MSKDPNAKQTMGSVTSDQGPVDIDSANSDTIGNLVPDEQVQEKVKIASVAVAKHHSGPLPHPGDLADYNKIIPDGADRIMQMAEKRQAHKIEMEKEALHQNFRYENMGQKFGAGLFLILLIFAVIVALKTQNPWLTGLFLGATAIGVIGMFIKGRREDDG